MSKKIYVGNLSFRTTEEELTSLFEQIGAVESVSIITDRDTGRSKGFGFVSMSDEDAEKAIAAYNGKEVGGRALTVNEARPMVKKEFTSRAGRNNRCIRLDPAVERIQSRYERLLLIGRPRREKTKRTLRDDGHVQ